MRSIAVFRVLKRDILTPIFRTIKWSFSSDAHANAFGLVNGLRISLVVHHQRWQWWCNISHLSHNGALSIHSSYVISTLIRQGKVNRNVKNKACINNCARHSTPLVCASQPQAFCGCQISNISRTKSQTLNVCRLVLQLPLIIILKCYYVLSREWRCSWSSADRRCSNYICVINNFIAY